MRITILLLLIFSLPLQAQTRQEKKAAKQQKQIEEFNELKIMIDSSFYVFTADRALPQGGKTINLTSHINFLRVMNDSVIADLPFFGRAYNIAYGGGNGGMKFQGAMNNYKLTENAKKQEVRITFKVSVPQDYFECTLEVYSSGSATLSVISQQRAYISYYGSLTRYRP